MITQPQYFKIEDYLQQECRIIEPELLEELIDQFMDGIEAVRQSDDGFVEAFEVAKADFGGESGVKRIQREWQLNALKLHVKGVFLEMRRFFQKPFLWYTLLLTVSTVAIVFYLDVQSVEQKSMYKLLVFCGGILFASLFIATNFLFENKSEFGVYNLQTCNWFSILSCPFYLLAISPFSFAAFLASDPLIINLITVLGFVVFGLLFISILIYQNKKLYPEHTWF